MIDLQNIEAVNFVTYPTFSLALGNIDDNLIFVEGDNLDSPTLGSNGSGKSLIFDMISWCLYGTSVRGLKADEPIGVFTDECLVRLDFKDGNDDVVVNRKRRKGQTELKFSIDGTTQGTKIVEDTQQKIDDWLMPWSVFRNSILMGQDDVNRFANFKDRHRKDLVCAIGGLNIFDPAREVVKEKRDEFRRKFDGFTTRLSMLEEQKELLRIEMADTKKNIEEKKEDINFKIYHYQIVQRSRKEQLEKLKKKVSYLGAWEKKLSIIKEKYIVFESEMSEEKDKIDIDLDYYMRLQGKFSTYSSAGGDGRRSLMEKHKELSLCENTDCPFCGVELTKAKIKKKVKAYDTEIKATIRYVKMYLQLAHIANLALQHHKDKFAYHIRERNKMKSALTGTELKILDRIEAIKEDKRDIQIVSVELREARLSAKTLKESKENLDKQIEDKLDKLNELQKKRTRIKFFADSLTNKLAICDYYFDLFGPKGLKAFAIHDIAELMNEKIGDIMEQIVDSDIEVEFVTSKTKKKTVSNEFDILVTDNTKSKDLRFDLWSGGEKERMAFAIMITLMSLVSSKVNLLMIDEALDKNISNVGVSRIIDFIKTLNQRVLLISHKSEMKSNFSTVLKVVKEFGKSHAVLN